MGEYALGQYYIFHLEASGAVTVLHQIAPGQTLGLTGLVAGNDGFLYGFTSGRDDWGNSTATLFRLSTSGEFHEVQFFNDNLLSLLQGQNGNLYFLTYSGGANHSGALFRCTPAGAVSRVYSFTGGADGKFPNYFAQGTDGDFYVIAHSTGDNSTAEQLVRISPSGDLHFLHRFAADAEVHALVSGANGVIEGNLRPYHTPDLVFRYAADSGVTTLHEFEGQDLGYSLASGNGLLYGVANDVTATFGYVFRIDASGQLTRFSEFRPGPRPSGPNDGLVWDEDESLYGTTTLGGRAGGGTVYKLAADGTLTVLHSFASDTSSSPSDLVLGGDGMLYGATTGVTPQLFRLTKAGAFTLLDSFQASSDSTGYYTLSLGKDGSVYGTTGGGTRQAGFIFKLAADGSLTKLYIFTGGADGGAPHSLIHATDGNLYGLADTGGANSSGTLFRLKPNGTLTVLKDFQFGSINPQPGRCLVQGSDGNLYCATAAAYISHGAYDSGQLIGMNLHGQPIGFPALSVTIKQLVAGSDGKLYGILSQPTDSFDFIPKPDIVFSCSFAGALGSLHEFNATTEGSDGRALLQGGDGFLYGTLSSRGPAGGGAVFQLPAQPTGTLLNLSARAPVLTGDMAMTAGFIISGDGAKTILVRGIGPSLAAAGLSDVLADPTLQLFDASGTEMGVNDNWSTEAGVSSTGLAPTEPAESAILRTFEPGAYTVVLRGKDATTGTGLIELYDVTSSGATSRLANISSRAFVGAGDNDLLIAGFIVADQGGGFGRVLARGIGPSLAGSGIQNPLTNPILKLYDANGFELTQNDDWRSPHEKQIAETGIPPLNDKESAIVITLRPGAYTAILRGVDGATGVGAVEIYGLH